MAQKKKKKKKKKKKISLLKEYKKLFFQWEKCLNSGNYIEK